MIAHNLLFKDHREGQSRGLRLECVGSVRCVCVECVCVQVECVGAGGCVGFGLCELLWGRSPSGDGALLCKVKQCDEGFCSLISYLCACVCVSLSVCVCVDVCVCGALALMEW